MSYLVNEAFVENLVLYKGKKRYEYSSEVIVNEPECMMELKSEIPLKKKEDEDVKFPIILKIKHSKMWFKEKKLFGRPEVVFVPTLIITITLAHSELEFMDRILLTNNIGFGMDVRDLLFGTSKSKYKVTYNGLNAALERCRDDQVRLVNFTLDEKITDYATRGFFYEAIKLREKIGDFDFEEVDVN